MEDSAPRRQFSLAQLLGLVTLAAGVFWLVQVTGLPVTLLLLGAVANLLVGTLRRVETMLAGAFWGALTHAVALYLAMAVAGGGSPPIELGLVLYALPGAWLGAVGALWRNASEIADIDRPLHQPLSRER